MNAVEQSPLAGGPGPTDLAKISDAYTVRFEEHRRMARRVAGNEFNGTDHEALAGAGYHGKSLEAFLNRENVVSAYEHAACSRSRLAELEKDATEKAIVAKSAIAGLDEELRVFTVDINAKKKSHQAKAADASRQANEAKDAINVLRTLCNLPPHVAQKYLAMHADITKTVGADLRQAQAQLNSARWAGSIILPKNPHERGPFGGEMPQPVHLFESFWIRVRDGAISLDGLGINPQIHTSDFLDEWPRIAEVIKGRITGLESSVAELQTLMDGLMEKAEAVRDYYLPK